MKNKIKNNISTGRLRKPHLSANAAMLCLLCLFLLVSCRTAPQVLFYQPPGTKTIVYKSRPEKLHITIYPPPKAPVRGAVIFIHGGGWQAGGSALPIYSDWHYPLQDSGLRAFSIEHRTAPKYRGSQLLADCIEAIRYIQSHADAYGFPKDRIALVGYSSGGHLAMLSALELTRRRPGSIRAVVTYYAPLDPGQLVYYKDNRLMRMFEAYIPETKGVSEQSLQEATHLDLADGTNPSNNAKARSLSFLQKKRREARLKELQKLQRMSRLQRFQYFLKYFSPIEGIHKKMPPALLIHGKKDRLVPPEQSINFALQAERLVRGRVRLLLIEKGDHNFVRSRRSWARKADRAALRFILEQLSN